MNELLRVMSRSYESPKTFETFHLIAMKESELSKVYTTCLFVQSAITPHQLFTCLCAGMCVHFIIPTKIAEGVIRVDYNDSLIISLIRVWIDGTQTASGMFELQCMHCSFFFIFYVNTIIGFSLRCEICQILISTFFFFFLEKKLSILEWRWHPTPKDYWRWNNSTQKNCHVNTLKFALMDNYLFCFIQRQDVDTTWSIKSSSSLLCVNSWKPHCDRLPRGTSCNLLWCASFILAVLIPRRHAEDAGFRRVTDAGVDSLSWCFNMSVPLDLRCFWDCINRPTGVWVEHVSFNSYACQDIIHHTSAAVPLFPGKFQRIAVRVICLVLGGLTNHISTNS